MFLEIKSFFRKSAQSKGFTIIQKFFKQRKQFIWNLKFSQLNNISKFPLSYISNHPRGVLKKRCSENIQQMYRRTPMPKCDFNKVAKQSKLQGNFIEIALRYGCSPINLLHIFKIPFPKNTSEGLLLVMVSFS